MIPVVPTTESVDWYQYNTKNITGQNAVTKQLTGQMDYTKLLVPRRKLDRRDDLVWLQIGVELRRVARQPVKIPDRYDSLFSARSAWSRWLATKSSALAGSCSSFSAKSVASASAC